MEPGAGRARGVPGQRSLGAFPQLEGSSLRWARGSSFGETVSTQQLGTPGVAGMPTPQGLAFWVLLCTRLHPHALNCVSRRRSACKTRAAWHGEESITRGDYSLLG